MLEQQQNLATVVHNFFAKLSYWPRTLRLIWEAAPGWTVAWAGLLIVQGVLPAASVYLAKVLVDSLLAAIVAKGNWQYVRHAVFVFVLAAGLMLLTELFQSAIDWIRAAQSELIQDHIKSLIHQQSATVDLAFYETPEYYDRLDQARSEASSRSLALLESGGSLVQNGITLFAMAAILIPYSAWLPLILLISTLPAFYVVLSYDRLYHRWWQRTTADRRWAQYFDVMLTHSMTAAELRLFGLGNHFQSAYQDLRRQLRVGRLTQMRKQSLASFAATLAALLMSAATMAWMVWRALHGLATLGDLALFYQAFSRGQGLMRSLLGSVGKILTSTLFLENLFTFLELKPGVVDSLKPIPIPQVLQKGIDFRNVSFRYPGSKRLALRDFNLSVPAGKIVAIVGANGAGKTTLLKLLCRFYDPEAGSIEVDGINVRDLAIEELRRSITVLFQFPTNYHATASRSIALGDIAGTPGVLDIETAARNAGAHEVITRLPQGYETLLGKWFDGGAELSAGEWQRIAMARAYLRQSPVILLDEPTSFMDSWSEADWFDRFHKLADARTAIVITHRFTVAMRADIIHVMDQGRIVESGSHYELLARGGLYAQSWRVQMQTNPAQEPELNALPYETSSALQHVVSQ